MGPRAGAELIARDRGGHGQRLMRAFGVVDGTPAIEGALSMRQIAQIETGDDVGFEGAMKAFVLALSLGVTRAAMNDADAEAQEPDPERSPALQRGVPPGRAIVTEDLARHAIALEGPLKIGTDISIGLTWARPQTESVAAMIVEDGQRMAALSISQGEVALEIHLPELIGSGSLEALPRLGMAARARFDQAPAHEDLMGRADRGQTSMTRIDQTSEQFASTPGGMLAAELQQRLLLVWAELGWAAVRAFGLIDQSGLAALGESPEPLVAALATQPEAAA